jgi:cytoskeletal protein CcmA (bactofilin family)
MSMWNKKREEESPKITSPPAPPRPAPSAAPAPVPMKKEATPLSNISSTPVRSPELDSARGAATIGKAVRVNGQIVSQEDLYVDGDVEGTIELMEHKLTIGPNGKVHAGVKAREVVVLGTISGNVEASDKLEIRKDAKLVGDIRTARIIIEDGAYFKGSIDIVKPEPAKAATQPARAPASPGAHSPGVAPATAAEAKR